jgi:hypothetical protein
MEDILSTETVQNALRGFETSISPLICRKSSNAKVDLHRRCDSSRCHACQQARILSINSKRLGGKAVDLTYLLGIFRQLHATVRLPQRSKHNGDCDTGVTAAAAAAPETTVAATPETTELGANRNETSACVIPPVMNHSRKRPRVGDWNSVSLFSAGNETGVPPSVSSINNRTATMATRTNESQSPFPTADTEKDSLHAPEQPPARGSGFQREDSVPMPSSQDMYQMLKVTSPTQASLTVGEKEKCLQDNFSVLASTQDFQKLLWSNQTSKRSNESHHSRHQASHYAESLPHSANFRNLLHFVKNTQMLTQDLPSLSASKLPLMGYLLKTVQQPSQSPMPQTQDFWNILGKSASRSACCEQQDMDNVNDHDDEIMESVEIRASGLLVTAITSSLPLLAGTVCVAVCCRSLSFLQAMALGLPIHSGSLGAVWGDDHLASIVAEMVAGEGQANYEWLQSTDWWASAHGPCWSAQQHRECQGIPHLLGYRVLVLGDPWTLQANESQLHGKDEAFADSLGKFPTLTVQETELLCSMLGAMVVKEFSNDWINHGQKFVVIAPDAACNVAEIFKDRYFPPPQPNQGQDRGVWNVEVVKTSWLVDSISANTIAPFPLYVKGIVEIQY